MLFNLKFASDRQLRKLDKQLTELKYDDLIAGISIESQQIINDKPDGDCIEELRVLYAIQECLRKLKEIYNKEE